MTEGTGPGPPITRVTGGVGGMSATYAHVRSLADRYDTAGDRMRGWAATGGRTVADHDLLESAPLSPVTFAEAEAAVLAATVGTRGVLVESVTYEADAVVIRATVTAFEDCDLLVRDAIRALDYAVGRAVGTGLGLAAVDLLPVALVGAGVAAVAWPHLPSGMRAGARLGATTATGRFQRWLGDHPSYVQHLVDGSGGLLDGLEQDASPGLWRPFHPTTAAAAGALAALYAPEGDPVVATRRDLDTSLSSLPPRDLEGLMAHLDETNQLSWPDRPRDQGTIEVQTLRSEDGAARRIVYLPGVDDFATTPVSQDAEVRDMATNLHLVAGDDTTYERGILEAMRRAGIGPDDPVLLVGHSQGGMVAAAMLSHGTPYHVVGVVTAASPTAQVSGYPPGSHVLSLENHGDVVPLLDGADNPDSVQQVTVAFDDHETSIVGNHDLGHYVRGAATVDASTDPSVREQLDFLRSQGFFDASAAHGEIFQVTR